jgi:hypothetical protein
VGAVESIAVRQVLSAWGALEIHGVIVRWVKAGVCCGGSDSPHVPEWVWRRLDDLAILWQVPQLGVMYGMRSVQIAR